MRTIVPDATVLRNAQRYLARRDPVLKAIIRTIGPCSLRYRPDRFAALVRSIISQQISTKAAAAIAARFESILASTGITPAAVLALSPEALRTAGLSAAKTRALYDLAEKIQDGTVPLKRIHKLPDEEVIASLLPVMGIGRWTAEMFLIFSLGRLDVFPVDDGGVRTAIRKQYGLSETPTKATLVERAEPWRPYRSIATWYFWRSLGAVPQSDTK